MKVFHSQTETDGARLEDLEDRMRDLAEAEFSGCPGEIQRIIAVLISKVWRLERRIEQLEAERR